MLLILAAKSNDDYSGLIWIVMVVGMIVLGKIAKWMAERKQNKMEESRKGDTKDHTAAEDLETFLDTLGRRPDEKPPAPPAQRLEQKVKEARERREEAARPKPRPAAPPRPSIPVATATPIPPQSRSAPVPVAVAIPVYTAPRPAAPVKAPGQRTPASPVPARGFDITSLRQPSNLRKAILFTEILGPPRSMRPYQASGRAGNRRRP